MKSIILRLVLVLAAFGIVPDALAADGGNAFLGATYGKTFVSSGDNSNSQFIWDADGGYLWKLDDTYSLGYDVGYVHFGNIPLAIDPFTFTTETATATALTVGGRFQHVFSEDKTWYLQLRAGLMSVKIDASYATFAPNPVTSGSESQRVSGNYYGLGIGRHLTPNFSLILAYDHYHSGDTSYQTAPQVDLTLNFLGLTAEYQL